MGRRNHLLRIALAANQAQIEEPRTPTESEAEEDERVLYAKNDKIQRFDMAQGAILNAIGFKSDEARKKDLESQEKELLLLSSVCQSVNYILPLPLASQRNQILVLDLYSAVANWRHFVPSIISRTFLCFEGVGAGQVCRYSGLDIPPSSSTNSGIPRVCTISNLESSTNFVNCIPSQQTIQ